MTTEEAEARFSFFAAGLFYLLSAFAASMSEHSATRILKYPPNHQGAWRSNATGAGIYALSNFLVRDPRRWLQATFLWFELTQGDPTISAFMSVGITFTHNNCYPDLYEAISGFPDIPLHLVDTLKAQFDALLSDASTSPDYMGLSPTNRQRLQYLQSASSLVAYFRRIQSELPGYYERHARHVFTAIHEISKICSTSLDSISKSAAIRTAIDPFLPKLVKLALDLYPPIDADTNARRMYDFLSSQKAVVVDSDWGCLRLLHDIKSLRVTPYCLNPQCFI